MRAIKRPAKQNLQNKNVYTGVSFTAACTTKKVLPHATATIKSKKSAPNSLNL